MSASISVIATEHKSIDNLPTGNILLKIRCYELPDKFLIERYWKGMDYPERATYVQERTCHIEERHGDWYCTCCGEMVGTGDTASELFISGNAVELWGFCPNCGAKVVNE